MRWPDFFIVGAAKAGTTSLYAYLRQHPDIFMPDMKEPHFFSGVQATPDQAGYVHSVTDEAEYLRLFEPGADAALLGEASPSYLWHPEAAARIHTANPDAKIIALLRDPIERAYSHYLMDVREGRQPLPFLEALREDYAAAKKGWGVSHLYVELGFYDEQVARYVTTFGEDRVLVLAFVDLVKEPVRVVGQALAFLGLDPSAASGLTDGTSHNPFAEPRGALGRTLMARQGLRAVARKLAPPGVRERARRVLLRRGGTKPPVPEAAVEFLRGIYS